MLEMDQLMRQFKLLALQAIPEIERQAIKFYNETRTKIESPEKWNLALDFGVAKYKQLTDTLPVIGDTTIDDVFVRSLMDDAMKWAWREIGDVVNDVTKEPSNVDMHIPSPGPRE